MDSQQGSPPGTVADGGPDGLHRLEDNDPHGFGYRPAGVPSNPCRYPRNETGGNNDGGMNMPPPYLSKWREDNRRQ
jgi:hypothetical protein